MLSVDTKIFDRAIEKEPEVICFLGLIYEYPEEYEMSAYTRTAIKSDIKKSELYSHLFYVIYCDDGRFYTLSFNETGISAYSRGVWAVNTDTDFNSYTSYLDGENIWDVDKIETDNEIDVKTTIFNVLMKIAEHITYYYRDHITDMPGMNSCVTALTETLAEKSALPET
ncbi:hypothetical protein FACS1894151_06980 [Spirochaetia bacterium]|nr:hypothetical protein FACS1894151_06980 [Spirochaetia bacterium]